MWERMIDAWRVVGRETDDLGAGDTPACVDSGFVLPHVEFVGPDSRGGLEKVVASKACSAICGVGGSVFGETVFWCRLE